MSPDIPLSLALPVIVYTPKREKPYSAAIVIACAGTICDLYVIPASGQPYTLRDVAPDDLVDRSITPNAPGWMHEIPAAVPAT